MQSAEERLKHRQAFANAERLDHLPHAKTHHSFLDANAQAHHDPLYAFADIIDNSREAKATRCRISMRDESRWRLLEIADDGEGMSEHTLSCAISIAYTRKDFTTGKHYGMGVTTAVPRLAKNALCFSYHHDSHHWTVAMVSGALNKKIGSDELKLPQCTWSHLMAGAILEERIKDRAPFSAQQRRHSLDVILGNSPFKTEEALLAEFTDIAGEGSHPCAGTKWVLWDVPTDELELKPGQHDVLVRGKRAHPWPHECSLRAYLEVLYYYDNEVAKRSPMEMDIQGQIVMPRNWSNYLHNAGSSSYKPHGGLPNAQAKLSFGYAKPLEQVLAAFEERGSSKNAPGAHYERLSQYMGVFYYHQGEDPRSPARLTIPLQRTKLQTRTTGALNTTNLRIASLGMALIGCCRENFLVQAHNKSEYVTTGSSTSQQHTILSLEAKVSDKMGDYLKQRVAPAIKGKVKSKPYGYRKDRKAWQSESEEEEEVVDVATDSDDDSDGGVVIAPGGGANGSAAGASTDAAENDADAANLIEEGGRYELIADPTVVGHAEWAGKGRKMVRLRPYGGAAASGKGRSAKSSWYRPLELRRAQLDTSTIARIPWSMLDISALDGAKVSVLWDMGAQVSSAVGTPRWQWFPGKLEAKKDAATLGWFQIVYDEAEMYEEEAEDIFIGIRADADECDHVAFRGDGTNITEEIRIDPVAFEAAWQAASQAAAASQVMRVETQVSSADAGMDVLAVEVEVEEDLLSSVLEGSETTLLAVGTGMSELSSVDAPPPPPPPLVRMGATSVGGASRDLQVGLASSETQAEIRSLRDQLKRMRASADAVATDFSSQIDALSEQVRQTTAAKESVERRLAGLRKLHEREEKRIESLSHQNDELKRQLHQAQRQVRAAQRVEMAPLVANDEPGEKRPLYGAALASSEGRHSGAALNGSKRKRGVGLAGNETASTEDAVAMVIQTARPASAEASAPAEGSVWQLEQQLSVDHGEAREGEEEEPVEHERAIPVVVYQEEVHQEVMHKMVQQQQQEASNGDDVEDDDDEDEVKVDLDDDQVETSHEPGVANPVVGDRVEIEWLLGVSRGLYTGVVDKTDWKISSQYRDAAFEYRYHVRYDDGDTRWETMGDITTRLTILERAAQPAASLAEGSQVLSRTRRRS